MFNAALLSLTNSLLITCETQTHVEETVETSTKATDAMNQALLVPVACLTWSRVTESTLNPWMFMPSSETLETRGLTDSHGSKLRGHQGAGAELVVGGNRGPVEEAVGPGRLERGRSRGHGRRGAGAHGGLRGRGRGRER